MRTQLRLSFLVVASLTVALLASSPSWAGNFKFHVRNASAQTVWIVMDKEREKHMISPNVTAIFEEANYLDNPTFRVYAAQADDSRGELLCTDPFNTLRFLKSPTDRSMYWNGTELLDEQKK
jgi:hypothetical protein